MTDSDTGDARGRRPRTQRSRGVRIVRRVGFSALGALALGIVAFLIWANIVMPAETAPLAEVDASTTVEVTESDSAIVMTPSDGASGTGIVFIPGAKVEPSAYEAVFLPVVADGTSVVITKPILNLAFFDQRSLSTFTGQAPDVESWFVGGHSLGGVRACQYAASDDPSVVGLMLFGSYCADDISTTDLDVLSVSGSEDGLSTPTKIDDAAHLLPAAATFDEIEGANHASFGAYGAQPGDGEATIPEAQARAEIADAVLAFLR